MPWSEGSVEDTYRVIKIWLSFDKRPISVAKLPLQASFALLSFQRTIFKTLFELHSMPVVRPEPHVQLLIQEKRKRLPTHHSRLDSDNRQRQSKAWKKTTFFSVRLAPFKETLSLFSLHTKWTGFLAYQSSFYCSREQFLRQHVAPKSEKRVVKGKNACTWKTTWWRYSWRFIIKPRRNLCIHLSA